MTLRRDQFASVEVDELRALTWVDAQDGHTSSARTVMEAAADLAAARGQRSFEMIILHDMLRLGDQEIATRARQVAEQVDGAWAAAIARHAGAVISADASDLASAPEAFTAIGLLLVAAELWAFASAVDRRRALRSRATHAANRSQELARRCEGARTDALEWAAAPVLLSRREREIAVLAAGGAANAQIAAGLAVSLRTVLSHLYSAFAKLGVSSRSQLPIALNTTCGPGQAVPVTRRMSAS